MYGRWNNWSWSPWRVFLGEDGRVHAVWDPRCMFCTARKSAGHTFACDTYRKIYRESRR